MAVFIINYPKKSDSKLDALYMYPYGKVLSVHILNVNNVFRIVYKKYSYYPIIHRKLIVLKVVHVVHGIIMKSSNSYK